MIIFGSKGRLHDLGGVGSTHCPTCDSTRQFRVGITYREAHVFWIPLPFLQWSKRYFAHCVICFQGFDVEKQDVASLFNLGADVFVHGGEERPPYQDPGQLGQQGSSDAMASFRQGVELWHRGDHSQALVNFDQAISLDPAMSDAYLFRGITKADIGDDQAALADFDRAIDLDPDAIRPYIARGGSRRELYDFEGAMSDLNRAIEIDSTAPAAYLVRAATFTSERNYQQAILDLNRFVELEPKDPTGFHGRAVAFRRLGQYDEALRDFEVALALADDQGTRIKLTGMMRRFRKVLEWPEADENACTETIADSSDGAKLVDIYYIRASLYVKRGAFEEALEDIGKAIELAGQPDQLKKLYGLRSEVYLIDLDDTDRAMPDIERLISLTTDPAEKTGLEEMARSIRDG